MFLIKPKTWEQHDKVVDALWDKRYGRPTFIPTGISKPRWAAMQKRMETDLQLYEHVTGMYLSMIVSPLID